tara:strand:- start:1270 stop:1431 length:162 start_codon:yes stop_codon:yes gene_type:complete
MKYIVAVKYKSSKTYKYEHEIFEFNTKRDRDLFINDIQPVAKDIALSQIEDID